MAAELALRRSACYPPRMRLSHASSALVCGAFLAISFGACEIKRVNDGGEGGSSSSDDGDGGQGGEAGQGGEGGKGSTCQDKSPDCRECRACAAAGPCKAAVNACLDDAICALLDQCLTTCGLDPDCEESCNAQFASGVELYDEAISCLDCAACVELCSGFTACGTM